MQPQIVEFFHIAQRHIDMGDDLVFDFAKFSTGFLRFRLGARAVGQPLIDLSQ